MASARALVRRNFIVMGAAGAGTTALQELTSGFREDTVTAGLSGRIPDHRP